MEGHVRRRGQGYVWHCHILDHEDNDMMRPMKMTMPASTMMGTRSQDAATSAPAASAPAGAPHHMDRDKEKNRY
jgi:Multicopper oxidase